MLRTRSETRFASRLPLAGTVALLLLAAVPGIVAPAVAQNDAAGPPVAGTPGAREKPPVTLEELGRRAPGAGLKGTMHGANHALGTYVFTWWDPDSFFRNLNFSLVPATPEVAAALAALERHQEVTLRGHFLDLRNPQPHLRVESVVPGEKWSPGVTAGIEAPPAVDLRKALAGKRRLQALVHAVSEQGGMLVVEWRGEVLPVFVPEGTRRRPEVSALYRGDRVDLAFRIREEPARPVHLELAPGEGERPPLVVTDRIRDQHEQVRTVEGNLVLFPKSPALRRAIYGVEETGPEGLHRYFTIFNFSDAKDQERIDALLSAAMRGTPEGVADRRNKYVHTRVRVRVTGKVNNPAQNQANPTLVTTREQVQVLAAPR